MGNLMFGFRFAWFNFMLPWSPERVEICGFFLWGCVVWMRSFSAKE